MHACIHGRYTGMNLVKVCKAHFGVGVDIIYKAGMGTEYNGQAGHWDFLGVRFWGIGYTH